MTLVEKLGSGGQGEVWRAADQGNPESVALKILSRSFVPGSDPCEVLQRAAGEEPQTPSAIDARSEH